MVRRFLYGLLALIVLAGAGGFLWLVRHRHAPAAAARPLAVQTAEVEKQTMSSTVVLPGTLGYGAARPVKGNRAGVVTWLPKPGTAVRRGKQVYRVDDQPVPLFYGGLPLFRTLATPNTTGRDVRIIADNLRALGYSIGVQPRAAHDGESVLTASLIAAIKRWQTDLHLPPTGHIAPGDVIVQPAAVRVDAVTAQPGDSADAALLSVTPTAKVITVSADPGQAGAIKRNDRVTVELPDSKTAKAKVTGVGTALQTPEAQTGDPDATPKLTVTVTVDDAEQIERLDAGDVQVDFAGETHRGVLVVPVGALVALSEGGYAVQLSDDTLIAVEVGLFAKGLVEVSGDGLTVGAKVVTTS